MADGFRLRLDNKGLSTLARTLRKAGADMQDLKAAYRQAASVAEKRTKPLTPRRSGKLAGTIRASATQKSGVVRAGSSRIPYAGVINYGWPGHNIKASNFMAKGLERSDDEIEGIFADAIDKALAQVKGN